MEEKVFGKVTTKYKAFFPKRHDFEGPWRRAVRMITENRRKAKRFLDVGGRLEISGVEPKRWQCLFDEHKHTR